MSFCCICLHAHTHPLCRVYNTNELTSTFCPMIGMERTKLSFVYIRKKIFAETRHLKLDFHWKCCTNFSSLSLCVCDKNNTIPVTNRSKRSNSIYKHGMHFSGFEQNPEPLPKCVAAARCLCENAHFSLAHLTTNAIKRKHFSRLSRLHIFIQLT